MDVDPTTAFIAAAVVFYAIFKIFSVSLPSRIIVAKPTTVWPLASVGAGLGAGGAVVLVLREFGAGLTLLVIAFLGIVLSVIVVGPSTTQPHRIVYERGGTAILRSRLLLAVGAFCVVWALLARA